MSSPVTLTSFLDPRRWYAWPALLLLLVMSWMPGRVLWLLGAGLGSLVSLFRTPNRRFAEKNLELCFPDMTPVERRGLAWRHFRLSGFSLLSLGVTYFAPAWRMRRFIAVTGKHHLDDAFASGKNVILLAPHFIGLDMGGVRLSMEQKYVSMYRKSRDPLLEYLFQRRERFGAVVVERSSSLKPVLRLIREGRPFYYLPDQDMGERASVFVPFFGIPAATITALSRIAETTNAAVIPCITRILPNGQGFEVLLHPPLDNFPTDDPVADAARMNQEIEAWVREMPDQYMWSYRRFKTRPNNEKSLYD
jgi:KDO2-lipid IV(A) lauroyltransferase